LGTAPANLSATNEKAGKAVVNDLALNTIQTLRQALGSEGETKDLQMLK